MRDGTCNNMCDSSGNYCQTRLKGKHLLNRLNIFIPVATWKIAVKALYYVMIKCTVHCYLLINQLLLMDKQITRNWFSSLLMHLSCSYCMLQAESSLLARYSICVRFSTLLCVLPRTRLLISDKYIYILFYFYMFSNLDCFMLINYNLYLC